MLELDAHSKKIGTIFVEKKAGLKQNHTHFKTNYDQEKLTKFIATFSFYEGDFLSAMPLKQIFFCRYPKKSLSP